jgi:hypothetical protein
MFANHPLVSAAPPSVYHPVGLPLEKFLYCFSRVKSFQVVLSSIIEPLSTASLPSNISEGLASLSASTSGSSLSGNGETLRATFEGSQNVIAEYPRFSFSRGGCSIVVDFGRSVLYFGLFYPWVEVSFANGVSSSGGARAVGSVSIFGSVLSLYSNDTTSQVYAQGRVDELYSFDSLKLVSNSKTSARFSGARNFQEYMNATLDGLACQVSTQGDFLDLSLPANAKSGHVRFSSDGPHSSFFSLDRLSF